jgi:Ca2+-binding EF-hand superfamily protein
MQRLPVRALLLVALFFSASLAARAQSDAQHVVAAIFHLFDENDDGYITTTEANHYIDKTFAEMDTRRAGRMTRDAWLKYSFGLADVAADQGRSEAYDLAKYRIFRRWDRDRSGDLTLEEYRAGVIADARATQPRGKKTDDEIRIDLAAFRRAPFIRALVKAMH